MQHSAKFASLFPELFAHIPRMYSSSTNCAQNGVSKSRLVERYRAERTVPQARGYELLRNVQYNKGMAFSLNERQTLELHGLLPPAFMTQDQQAHRVLRNLRRQPDDLARYVQLEALQNRNDKLFYRVLCDNLAELMPIVYTPTVGQACQEFGHLFRYPKGLYVTIHDNSISKIYQILSNWRSQDVKAIVVTDGERILGLGDLGSQGIDIPVGKMALYVALAGIQPSWCLPVQLDVGSDNSELLEDPFYTGLRMPRVRGEAYDRLLENFMVACQKRFGHVLIQFEDFANQNAFRLLQRYQNDFCCFDDDIQGTGAVGLAGLLACSRVTGTKMSQMRLLFFGAGEANMGIAELCAHQMVSEGLSPEEANANIFLIDSKGLITTHRNPMDPRHAPFAKNMADSKDLLAIIRQIRPNALIGASTVKGAFNAEVLRTMAEFNRRPIVFALSNPTSKAECTAEEAYRITDGRVLFAGGSPFDTVKLGDRTFHPGQANNAHIFPGIALGAILFQLERIDPSLFAIAAQTVADSISPESLAKGTVYPELEQIRENSVRIAVRIGEESYKNGTAKLHPEPEDKELFVRAQMFKPDYEEQLPECYDWPKEDMKHGFHIEPEPNN